MTPPRLVNSGVSFPASADNGGLLIGHGLIEALVQGDFLRVRRLAVDERGPPSALAAV
jgi:hypothetical protein